ncbi:MAG: hypothetical protein ASARMPREDX12_002365 [Alectoria sarmentosa]|nr:MAG: hypothetical protein ASARMPREDX12_002365 [Alectoria sarmentosa]
MVLYSKFVKVEDQIEDENANPIEAREVLYVKPSAEKVKDQAEAKDTTPFEARAKVVYPFRSSVEDQVEAEDATSV